MFKHTSENSWHLTAVFFCHVIADVASCVTWRKQAFDIERSKLGKKEMSEQASDVFGLRVD